GEIAALFTPADDGAGDAIDQLAHGVFALSRSGLAVKVFAGDDIGGGLRPILRDFDALLAEDGHALFIADQRGALLPLDGVEGRTPTIRKISIEHEPSVLAGCLVRAHSRL